MPHLTPSDLRFHAGYLDGLRAHEREAVIGFLLRWEAHETAARLLDDYQGERLEVVSLYDLLSQALLGLGRAQDALDAMAARNALRRSATSTALEARCHLALGDARQALAIAEGLTARSETQVAWALLVDARLAVGNLEGALEAANRLREIAGEESRAYLLAMLSCYQALGDGVAASGYAVRLEQTAEALHLLPAALLRRLREHYRATSEVHRVALVEAALSDAYEQDLERLAPLLTPAVGEEEPAGAPEAASQAPRDEAPPRAEAPARGRPARQEQPEPAHVAVVSGQERALIEGAVTRLFGHRALLPGQAETMAAALRGQDVLTVLPTGGGKSLCYQLPALMDETGATLVISPLIALMKDQVESLPEDLAARATTINSSLDGGELTRRLAGVAAGTYRLIYAAPERLRQPEFLHALRQAPVRRLVIDEAHCVSMWGHDFRPDYLYVGRARRALGNPPVLAMTATAPPRVRDDILQRVHVDGDARAGVALVATDITRPNLYFEAIPAANQDEKLQALLSVCLAEPESGIVYVSSRARAESLADLLRQHGIEADYYHAGIADPEVRSARQDAFMSGRMRVMVATIAFGMGIDKSDIRFIVHYDLPASLESYYQEAGRAGRDGLPARCVLIHAPSDRATLTRRMNGDRLAIEDLRRVYAAVRGRLGGERIGRVLVGALAERGARDGETRARVALSLLEEAGQLRRHEDVARTISVRCLVEPPAVGESDPPGLGALCAAAGLTRGAQATFDPLVIAQAAGLDPITLEAALWRWEAAGHLKVRTTGRDLLLELLPPEPNASERVNRLLDAYAAVQVQRIDEVAAYARTRRCRHGHISAYLMGEGGKRCASCDNCVPGHPLRRFEVQAVPGETEQAEALLRVLAEGGHGWGRASLMRILRADPQAPERGRQSAQWGALSHRSPGAIDKLVDRLLGAGLLRERSLDHGGVYVEITEKGERALEDLALLDGVLEPPRRRSATASRSAQGSLGQKPAAEEQELYERLRQWRNETAQEEQVPAYVVLSNATLRALAAARPRTREELLAVSGIGPKRAEQRGPALLRLIGELSDS